MITIARWVAVLSFGLSGCAASTVLEAKDFERECDTAAQCRPVFFGDVCKGCTCQNGAVNEQGFIKYQLERENITCPQTPYVGACDCAQPALACVDGLCATQ